MLPLLDTVRSMGGRGRPKDVANALADRLDLAPQVRSQSVTYRDGKATNLWDRHVRWALLKAKALGYVRAERRGEWTLAEETTEALDSAIAPMVVVTVVEGPGDGPIAAQVEVMAGLPTIHTMRLGSATDLQWIGDGQIGLVVTSIPYFDLVRYPSVPGQLADAPDYWRFLSYMDEVLAEYRRVLRPGGMVALNCADVVRSRKKHGTHHLLPLHGSLMERGMRHGFQLRNGIVWQKITSCRFEEGPGGVLGTPGQPGGAVKMEVEHILLMRNPGPYPRTTPRQRDDAHIRPDLYQRWFRNVWTDVPGARPTKDHPCPWPVEVPYRLCRMFSRPGDTILDTFAGRMTTTIGAMLAGRNSAACEVVPRFFRDGVDYVRREAERLAKLKQFPMPATVESR